MHQADANAYPASTDSTAAALRYSDSSMPFTADSI
ncbi:MAG: hypothetical protein ACI8XW_003304, partial [Gammaproteobacteria bacterium]